MNGALRIGKAGQTQSQLLTAKAKTLIANHRKKAKALGVTLDYDKDDLLRLLTEAKLCEYCLLPLGLDMEIDHAEPVIRGPKACCFDNLRVCCGRCNRLKGALGHQEMVRLLEFLRTLDPRSEADLRRRLAQKPKWK